ncbi:unnamed protein product [Clonostachys rosea]|uniref:Nudix hydrolase domain-containing protein n=1 Tax=Bionectria ochroleuca TaxID=29856 RepID=A0ABY6U8E9_BIOOC|nr:unnamed protein product [Clonostachys rosea]
MAQTHMQLEDWLDDLCVRFIINLPEEDLSSVARICFQVEEAQWFYEDFIRPLDPNLPSMTLRTFSLRIFQHCPLLASFSTENHIQAFEEFLEYKTRVPVRGAILLNHEMDSTVLVKGWKKGANWSFPRGKINKDEDDLDCAIREVWEETGLDLREAGLVPTEKPKYIEITMREQQMRLYVFRDVPMDTVFQPQTRKEISKIEWYRLSELPAFRKKKTPNGQDASAGPSANKFYMVAPFLVPLKKWVISQKKLDVKKFSHSAGNTGLHPHHTLDEVHTEDDTWPQPAPEAILQTHNSLEDATHELQRLLKMQPPTQGLQAASATEDKASALLSMLQAGGSNPATSSRPGSMLPHTPMNAGPEPVPQPRNPHHHTNQHHSAVQPVEPPPPFPLNQYHQGSHWNTPQNLYQQPSFGNVQASLVHPQPLPPQVQRAVFDRAGYQENQPPLQNNLPQAQQEQGYTVSRQSSLNLPIESGKTAHLDGQSMALLNAFKQGDPAPVPAEQLPPKPNPFDSNAHSGHASYHHQQQAAHGLSFPSELAASSHSSSQHIPAAKAPTEPNRSALLGLFKNPVPETTTNMALRPFQDSTLSGPRPQGAATGIEKQLLDAFRGIPPGPELSAKPPHPIHSQPADPSAALSNFLALKPRQEYNMHSRKTTNENMPIPTRTSTAASANAPSQPIRILQRGQGDPFHFSGHPERTIPNSPYSSQVLPGTVELATSADRSSVVSPSAGTRRAEVSQDQKKQLLSLFGKQPNPNAPGHDAAQAELAAPEPPRSRLVSLAGSGVGFGTGPPSRNSSQTPISPADQSFLLDYLQSVTNNASR